MNINITNYNQIITTDFYNNLPKNVQLMIDDFREMLPCLLEFGEEAINSEKETIDKHLDYLNYIYSKKINNIDVEVTRKNGLTETLSNTTHKIDNQIKKEYNIDHLPERTAPIEQKFEGVYEMNGRTKLKQQRTPENIQQNTQQNVIINKLTEFEKAILQQRLYNSGERNKELCKRFECSIECLRQTVIRLKEMGYNFDNYKPRITGRPKISV